VHVGLTEASGVVDPLDDAPFQSGRDIRFRNLPSGETTGALHLGQSLAAGSGSRLETTSEAFDAMEPARYRDIDGGDAHNELDYVESVDRLDLHGETNGGSGGTVRVRSLETFRTRTAASGDGGDAHTIIRGVNDAGSIHASGRSFGGRCGGCDATLEGSSGVSIVDVEIRSLGDGHDVTAGLVLDADGRPIGGSFAESQAFLPRPAGPMATIPWSADTRSVGIAEGDSRVASYAQSTGNGGGVSPDHMTFARASSTSRGNGVSTVEADAWAEGGGRGARLENGRFVSATVAEASAEGLGAVRASAFARGRSIAERNILADAEATAHGRGAELRLNAGVESSRRFPDTDDPRAFGPPALSSNLDFVGRGAATIHGVTRHGDGLLELADGGKAGHDVRFSWVGDPSGESRDRIVEASALLSGYERAGETVLTRAAGQLQVAPGRQDEVGDSIRSIDSTFLLDIAAPAEGERLLVTVFDLEAVGAGFDTLTLSIEDVHGDVLVDATFQSLDEAVRFFKNQVIDLGRFDDDVPGYETAPRLTTRWEVTAKGGDGVSIGWGLTIVPEPGTALLLGLGLAGLGAGRTRRDRAPSAA